jgi:alcohol dehydrogenase
MGCGSSLRTGLKLRQFGCKKVMAVYDKGVEDTGIAKRIVENIQNAGIEVVCFNGVLPDPPDTMVEKAAEIARSEAIDGIVAIGGGSAIDTAKGINVLINNPPPLMQYFGLAENLKPGIPQVNIPTTSGTGSETTNMAVISCVSLGKKFSVVSSHCVGKLAILDPELTVGLPPKMTASTGIDALAHATEALTGGQENPLSDALARDAIRTIVKWLPVAYRDGKNIEARENMLQASMFAGMSFTNALVHVGHSTAHVFGATFHIPHGVACGIILPQVIEFSAVTEYKKVRMICECMGVDVPENATPEEIGTIARKALRAFTKSVGIPNLKDLGISEDDAVRVAPLVTQDGGFVFAPFRIPTAKVAEMIQSAYGA